MCFSLNINGFSFHFYFSLSLLHFLFTQVNPEQKTLQADFELALLKAKLLNPLNFGYPHKYGWSTSGRTDRGVHACAQVCSAKLQLQPDQTMDDVRNIINQFLTETFQVLDVIKTSRTFHAKTGRSHVRYQYMIPSFCFFPRDQLRELLLKVAPLEKEGRGPAEPLSAQEMKEIQTQLQNYRIDTTQRQALQTALQQYCGTHSFHNFTPRIKAGEATANRYIMSFHVEDPIIFDEDKNGIEWIPTQVTGQAFLLHQIRKMISLAIDCVRMNMLPTQLIPNALQMEHFKTGLAPAQGLFLEMSYYDGYNRRILELKQQQENGRGQPNSEFNILNWNDPNSDAYKRWKLFRDSKIMKHVVHEEQQEGNFISYLYSQEFYFDHDEYKRCLETDTPVVSTSSANNDSSVNDVVVKEEA